MSADTNPWTADPGMLDMDRGHWPLRGRHRDASVYGLMTAINTATVQRLHDTAAEDGKDHDRS